MKKRIIQWSEFKVGDLIECRADGELRTLLVCEKIEADKNSKHSPLRLAVLYHGDQRYTLFENDLNKNDGVCLVWEGGDLQNKLKSLQEV